jgi:hypothetical protein
MPRIPHLIKLASIALMTTTIWANSTTKSLAASSRYYCAILGGVPHTFAKTSRGNIAIIKWEAAGKYSAKERCIIVSRRFQAAADNGMLKYIGTGIVNNQSAICAVVNKGDACVNNNLLITLTATDRHEAARQLLDIGRLARTGPITIRGEETTIEDRINGESYFDMGLIEEVAPVTQEEEISAIEP